MCDFGKLSENPCEGIPVVTATIGDRKVRLCSAHASMAICNLLETTNLSHNEQVEFYAELAAGEIVRK